MALTHKQEECFRIDVENPDEKVWRFVIDHNGLCTVRIYDNPSEKNSRDVTEEDIRLLFSMVHKGWLG